VVRCDLGYRHSITESSASIDTYTMSVKQCPPMCDPYSCNIEHDVVLVQLLNVRANNLKTYYERHLLTRFMKELEQVISY